MGCSGGCSLADGYALFWNAVYEPPDLCRYQPHLPEAIEDSSELWPRHKAHGSIRVQEGHIADGHPFFARVIETGSHPGNLDRIARAEAEATAVDNVTYAFWCHYRPEAAPHVRVLARTPPSPATPFVTSTVTSAATVEVLREALRELAHNPCYAKARRGLLMTDIVDVPATAYRGLLDYEREAAQLGYPALA